MAKAILEVLAPCENGVNCPNPGEGKPLVPLGISKLSELEIDVHKDWGGYRIENLGAPTASGHAARLADIKEATKEIFKPVTYGTDIGTTGTYPHALIDTADESGFVILSVPHDFSSLTSIEIIFIAYATAADMHITINTNYCKVGESAIQHQDLMLNASMGAVTNLYLHAFSIAAAVDVASLEVGDIIGIEVLYSPTATATNIALLGVRFRYS